jgi:hypothetical protein
MTLRRWPARNFLAELEPELRDRYALDDLALRDPRCRHAYRKVQMLGRILQSRMGGPDWVRFTDARTSFQTALFELAFNLGFENGMIRTRAESLRGGKTHPEEVERRFSAALRSLLAAAPLTADRAMLSLLELAYALAAFDMPRPAR